MNRATLASPLPSYSHGCQDTWARLLVPLTLCICASLTLRYGYYGNSHLVLGPNSSCLLKATSIFVEQIQVRDEARKGLFLYGLSEKPELSLRTTWNVSQYLLVGTHRRRGFSLWLNKGSRVLIAWTLNTNNFYNVMVDFFKGEQNYVTVQPSNSTNSLAIHIPTNGNGQAEYLIEEDNSYYVGVVNMNPRSIIMALNVSVSSMMYDTTKAKRKCSTINGLCQLKLFFPKTQFFILSTPNNGDLKEWYIELSFMARLVTYFAILGTVMVVISLILKYLGVCEGQTHQEEVTVTESDPLILSKTIQFTYGTGEEDTESGMCSSSEDLYDGKICVICYDEPRNCFFVPCGHCATCYECAQRIFNGENKVCPICRRPIHKVRKID